MPGRADLYTQMHESNQPASPTHSWPNLVACLAAAFLVWWLSPQTKARAMESDEKRAWMVSSSQDVAANESEPSSFRLAYFRETDSCFFIPVQYWPTLLCTLVWSSTTCLTSSSRHCCAD